MPQGKQLLLAGYAVLLGSIAGTGPLKQQVQAAAIRKLQGLSPGLARRIARSDRGMWTPAVGIYPMLYPRRRIETETKKAGNPCCYWVSGLIGTLTVHLMVEVGGIEPPSEGTPSPALHA